MIALREASYDPVHDGQRHFRILLDAMAHPGQIRAFDCVSLAPPAGLDSAGAAIALALLNTDVQFAAFGHSEAAVEYLRQNTRCPLAGSTADADFLFFASPDSELAALAEAKTGHPQYPETGATAVIQTGELAAEGLGGGALTVVVEGPGVAGAAHFQIKGVLSAVLGVLLEKNAEYPLGIDTIFTCGERLVCVPRSSRIRWDT